MSNEIRKNSYRIVWEHINGHVSRTAEIDAVIHGDPIVEIIHVLTEFHSIFFKAPPPVKRIVEVKLVRENW